MSPIICDGKEDDEDMTSNMRVRFHERWCKCLSKSIAVNSITSKKACPELAPNPPSMPALSTTVMVVTLKPDEKLPSTDDISYHETKRPFFVLENFSKESFKCMNCFSPRPKTAYLPSREEISKLLTHIPSFIEKGFPVQNIGVFFLVTQQILVEIDKNPSQSFMTRLLYDTPDTAITHILHLQDYVAFETTEVVGLLPYFRL